MVLKVRNVSSGYRQVPVVQNISFDINMGEIVGLVGLNGAGKSTLLKTILGLLKLQKGEIKLNGQTILENHQAYASQIAYIPETPILYEELTLREHIEMVGLGYNIPKDQVMLRAEPLLKLFRLNKQLNWFPTHFSKGMKQKVMIICAFITDASLFIIDEPFLGLDPLAIRDLAQLMKDKAQAGKGILFTTHVLSMTDSLCDNYLMLQGGQLVAKGNLASLRQQFQMPQASLEDIYIKMTEMGDSE